MPAPTSTATTRRSLVFFTASAASLIFRSRVATVTPAAVGREQLLSGRRGAPPMAARSGYLAARTLEIGVTLPDDGYPGACERARKPFSSRGLASFVKSPAAMPPGD